MRFGSFETQNPPIARSIRDVIPSRVSYHLALVLVCAPFNSSLAPRRLSPLLFPSRTHFALTALSSCLFGCFPSNFSRLLSFRCSTIATQRNSPANQSNPTQPKLVFCLIFIHPFIVKFSPSCRSRRLRVWTRFSSTFLFFHVSFFYCLESSCFPVSPADSARFCEVYLSGIIFRSTKLPPQLF